METAPDTKPSENHVSLREKAIKNIAKRPNYGRSGRHTHIITNYFEVKRIADKSYLEKYEITMKLATQQRAEGEGAHRRKAPKQSKQLSVNVQRSIFQQLEKQERNGWFKGVGVVFDGNETIYSTGLLVLKSDTGTTSVTLKDDPDSRGGSIEYKVEVNKLDRVDLEELRECLEGKEMKWEYFDLAGIRGLNALIHHMPSMRYTQFGESTYLPSTRKSLGGGVELWMGWFESVRPGQDSYFINVNTTYTVFYEPLDLSQLIARYLNTRFGEVPDRLSQEQQKHINELIRGLKFRPLHRPQVNTRFKIKRLCPNNVYEVKVEIPESGEKIDISSYYKRKYNIAIRYKHLVETEGRRADKYPIELCGIVEGQRFPVAKLTSAQRGKMIKHTALRPGDNVERINEGVQNVLQFEKDFKLNDFGMNVEQKMVETPARILRPPQIAYHSSSKAGETVKPSNGGWNLKDRKFVRSGEMLRYWVVVVFVRKEKFSHEDAEQFIKVLVSTSKNQGMSIAESRPRIVYAEHTGDQVTYQRIVEREYYNARNALNNDLQLMLFILPDDDEKRYRAIKYTADTILGVPTQCVQLDKVSKKNKQYCANVALKMNLKLGGTNQSLKETEIPLFEQEPVILLGADVTHPTGGRAGPSSMPSICAVVGSLDRQGGRFVPKLESQKTRQEKIENMGGMVLDILKDYREKNRILPRRIIMYRDGVSESQFEMVLTHELVQIKDACRRIDNNYMPPITFVIVGKRHHTRFYPKQECDTDSKGNCVAGTVVDRKITHPYLFDFFLQSHSSLHGTSRPAHYHVLFDENKFNADTLQNMTHKLCYNYQRATRSVSISPAAYYAHLAAKRARLHLEQRPCSETEFVLKEVKESLSRERELPGTGLLRYTICSNKTKNKKIFIEASGVMARPSTLADSSQSNRILYDIDVVAVWKPDDETSDQESESQVNTFTNADPSYSQLPSRVFKHVTHRLARSFEGLTISTTVPPALIQALPKVTSEWLMQLSPDGKYLAVLQEHKIEIRTSESGFEKNHAIFNSKRDTFPAWRRLAWSMDSKILAATRSDGTVEIINKDGQLVCVILSSTTSDSEIESHGSSRFFIEPVAFLSFVDPKRGSNKPLNFERHTYQYELIVITYDSVLRSYLLNTPESAAIDENDSLSRRAKANATYPREGTSDPGFFTFYHKFYFKQWLITVVCGVVATANGFLLCLGGEPNSEDGKVSTSVACWRLLQDRPFYHKLEFEGSVDVSNDDISNLSQGDDDDVGLFSRIKNVFSIWRKVNKNFTNGIVHSMFLSPNQNYLLTLDFSGSVNLWELSFSKGVVIDRLWNQSWLNYLARGREYKELSFEDFREKITDAENDGDDVPGLENGRVVSVGWWSDSALIFGYQSGSVIIASLPEMVNILGDSPETFKSCREITSQCNNCFLVIEHEVKIIRARVHGDNVISYSRAQEEVEVEDDEFEESQSPMSRLISAIANSLHYITDTVLWHFESDSSTIRGRFITIPKRTFRLNRISKILPQDLLYRKINALEYDDALLIAETYNLDTDVIYQARWHDAEIHEVTIHDYLDKIHDRQWVLSACLHRITNFSSTIRLLLSYGLDQTDIINEVISDNLKSTDANLIIEALREHPLEVDPEVQGLLVNIQLSEKHKITCRFRHYFFKYLDRLCTFENIVSARTERDIEDGTMDSTEENGDWVSFVDYHSTFADDYAVFRDVSIAAQAIDFAADEFFNGLHILFTRHGNETLPYRFTILEQIPETADPNVYESFLPSVGSKEGELYECLWHEKPWRDTDWVENPNIKQQILLDEPEELDFGIPLKSVQYPAPSSIITQWYIDRAHKIDSASGQVENALALVRHGIKKNVRDLETLEEDLHMLSQLVYECYPSSNLGDSLMTLEKFETLSESEIVQTFLSQTNEKRIVNDIKQYILPFLKLLPARRVRQNSNNVKESAAENDPMELLYDYILDKFSSNAEWCCLLFEASKSTMDIEDRIITSDEDLARVILACLYGNASTNELNIMTRMFECFPIFNVETSEIHSITTEINSLQSFTSYEFLKIFKTKDESQLQNIIDFLEIHLNAAEILSRYDHVLPLRWFIQSADNYTLQKQLCIKLTRKVNINLESGKERFESDDEWHLLLEGMQKMRENGILGKISTEELYKDFISGLLSCGKFRLSQEILIPTDKPQPLSIEIAEQLVIDASREFFDNASSGNMYHGYMKMAYECLRILPVTDSIKYELELIEAAHILSEKKVCYQPGIPIHPMQIRLSQNRLDLIERLLNIHKTAYKEPQFIMELAIKLGYRNDKVAEIKVMAMLADAALRDSNVSIAYRMCTDLTSVVKKCGDNDSLFASASDIAWKICYEVAKQEDYEDLEQKMTLMGFVLALCPSDQAVDILNLWRKLDYQRREAQILRAKTKSSERSKIEKIKPAVERVESVLTAPLLQGDRLKNLVSSWLGSGF
ncbi:8152_t:CDS:10 [Acaulospora morrowiae]|uniref:8152_t:CDS:1 n=1 Tax=Acaulospora morrowiae TaxID=94023 RepID=A0A9N8Z5C3_9GLOM|nr:8152_t:CDS:10 [Acaulospora morrowiae]